MFGDKPNLRKEFFGGFNRDDVASAIEEIAKQRNSYRAELEELEKDTAVLRDELDASKQSADSAREELETLKIELDGKIKESELTQGELYLKKKELEAAKLSAETGKKEIERLKADLDKSAEEIETLNDKIISGAKETEILKTELENVKTAILDKDKKTDRTERRGLLYRRASHNEALKMMAQLEESLSDICADIEDDTEHLFEDVAAMSKSLLGIKATFETAGKKILRLKENMGKKINDENMEI